jgi:hypothetical protein
MRYWLEREFQRQRPYHFIRYGQLARLPKEFRTSDLRKIGVLRNKQSSEIYNGISRWTDAGLVKRKERGVYQRLS